MPREIHAPSAASSLSDSLPGVRWPNCGGENFGPASWYLRIRVHGFTHTRVSKRNGRLRFNAQERGRGGEGGHRRPEQSPVCNLPRQPATAGYGALVGSLQVRPPVSPHHICIQRLQPEGAAQQPQGSRNGAHGAARHASVGGQQGAHHLQQREARSWLAPAVYTRVRACSHAAHTPNRGAGAAPHQGARGHNVRPAAVEARWATGASGRTLGWWWWSRVADGRASPAHRQGHGSGPRLRTHAHRRLAGSANAPPPPFLTPTCITTPWQPQYQPPRTACHMQHLLVGTEGGAGPRGS
jgi:hypothetical protein